MTDKTIANSVKLSFAMPTICSEISQFGDRHPMLNRIQHGVTISDFQFWSIFGCFLKKQYRRRNHGG
jgi:hypothetical protein